MSDNCLDKFGELLMTHVRDKTIEDWDKIIDGRMKGLSAERVRKELIETGVDHSIILRKVIPRIVDTTLHHLLWTLEQESALNLSIETESDSFSNVCDASDGLSGELYGKRGWIARFSKERHEE